MEPMSKEDALTEAVIDQLRERLPDVIRRRGGQGRRVTIHILAGRAERADIEFPPEYVAVRFDAQRT